MQQVSAKEVPAKAGISHERRRSAFTRVKCIDKPRRDGEQEFRSSRRAFVKSERFDSTMNADTSFVPVSVPTLSRSRDRPVTPSRSRDRHVKVPTATLHPRNSCKPLCMSFEPETAKQSPENGDHSSLMDAALQSSTGPSLSLSRAFSGHVPSVLNTPPWCTINRYQTGSSPKLQSRAALQYVGSKDIPRKILFPVF